ncbi:MAG: alpha-L-fucosidase [Rhodopirellula sp. JB044]|uniref:alpha-L-fucosidase n=1 Tax=Rhodopirellula sp. JB044 TaxID=3342844 RepID=UPI00370BB62C
MESLFSRFANAIAGAVILAGWTANVCVNAESPVQPFRPTWESLEQYECPEWFRDAKFGIYAHWGIYSASMGTRNTDWYGRNMYVKGHPNRLFHEETYGPVSEHGYKDLIPRFTAEKFDADQWADLYVESGAKFAGPVAEHSDGFSMWDSKVNPFNAAAMGPTRDVVAEMKTAIEKRGMKFVTSMHHSWHWGWFPTWDENTDTTDPEFRALYGPILPATAQKMALTGRRDNNMVIHPRPTPQFEEQWLNKIREVVQGYSPDLLWFDNRMQTLTEDVRLKMASEFYNHAIAGGQEPVLTFKRPDMKLGTGTVDLERARMPDIYPEPWLTDTSISASSWSYADDITYYDANRIVDDLVDIVSKNGCLLLNIAPHPDGTIPKEQQQILREVGAWLKINGEAIYGSRPWLVFGEGPSQTPTGHLADQHFQGFQGEDIRFTTQGNTLYAIALGKPTSGNTVTVHQLSSALMSETIDDVRLLGYDGSLRWQQSTEGLSIELPSDLQLEHAFVFRIDREM